MRRTGGEGGRPLRKSRITHQETLQTISEEFDSCSQLRHSAANDASGEYHHARCK